MRIFILFFVFVLTVLGAPSFGAAQDVDNPYIVRDVTVDIVSQSAVKAREKAFAQAQLAAFDMLTGRFLTEIEREGRSSPDPAQVSGMVQDFELVSEQTSRRRYIGKYVFRFKEQAVKRYFGRSPLEEYAALPSSQPRGNLLIIPFFKQGDVTALWDSKKNPWIDLWREKAKVSERTYVLPIGDVSDIMDVRDNQGANANLAALKRLKSRYGAQDAIIMIAIFDRTQTQPLTVQLYRTDLKKIELAQTISIDVGTSQRLGQLLENAVAQLDPILKGNWKKDPAFDPVITGVASTKEIVQDKEPEINAAPSTPPQTYVPVGGEVRVRIRFGMMADWLVIRRALNSIVSIKSSRILSLRSDEAEMMLSYTDWSSLQAGLAARGFSLQVDGADRYILTRTSNFN